MYFQEIITILLVASAAIFSIRAFVKQFSTTDSGCSSCSCEPAPKKIFERNRNSIRYKKI